MEKTEETAVKPEADKAISKDKKALIERMFDVGAHYGYSKSKRHPSTKKFVYGSKNKAEIFDLDKTSDSLAEAKDFVAEIAKQGKQILFVSSKLEVKDIIKNAADSIDQPYVAGRWIGGTLTNYEIIKKRSDKLVDLRNKKEKGELGKYTKKEQLLIQREVESLEGKFDGIVGMKGFPAAVFIIDIKKEDIALKEAKTKKIPVISLSSNDCNISDVEYPIPGNDATRKSIEFFVSEIVEAYNTGKKSFVQKTIK